MTTERVAVSFANHADTTAWHLVRAMRTLGTDPVLVGPGHDHLTVPLDTSIIWVETSPPWIPTEILRGTSPNACWIIDSHRAGRWRRWLADLAGSAAFAQRKASTDQGRAPAWLPLAAPADLAHAERDLCEREHDVAFVGQAPDGSLRARVLERLAREFRVHWVRQRVLPAEMMRVYGTARVVLNPPLANDLNMRAFEAGISRAMQLCGPMDGIDRVLAPQAYRVVASNDPEDWAEAARVLLGEPRAQRAVDETADSIRRRHTYRERAETLLSSISEPPPVARRDLRIAAMGLELGDRQVAKAARLSAPIATAVSGLTVVSGRLHSPSSAVGARLRRISGPRY